MHTRLLLVRHGQTDWNVEGRIMGQLDIPLNALGVRQAAAAARAIAQRLIQEAGAMAQAIARPLDGAPDGRPELQLFTSDLGRARATAAAIHADLLEGQPGLPAPALEPRLREMNFGEWEGLTYAEMKARDPERVAAWETDMLHIAPPGGETLTQFAARVEDFYQEIVRKRIPGTALVVAHGGPLSVLVVQALGLPPERYWQFNLSNTGMVELNLYPVGAILNRFNDTAHLQEIE
ncbi:MAG: histidine phosphatase family protein [Chloroflexota bacterium]